jgi:hypothetical protein
VWVGPLLGWAMNWRVIGAAMSSIELHRGSYDLDRACEVTLRWASTHRPTRINDAEGADGP